MTSKPKYYLVITQMGTDEDFHVINMTAKEIDEFSKKCDYGDFVVIDGAVVKGGGQRWEGVRPRD